MSQSASGTGNIQVSVAASQNVIIVINGQTAVELESRDFPLALSAKTRREIDLLKAPFAQTPFTGRDSDLDNFLQWCTAKPEALLMRTVVGRGGAGKTRFAYELYARVRQQPDWEAYFLRFHANEAKGVNLWKEIHSKNALIIADYASDWANPLADLLRGLTRKTAVGRLDGERKIRVLLLARTANWDQGWLAGLSSERTGESIREYFEPLEPMELLPLDAEGRRELFHKTVALAAEYMGKPVPPPVALDQFERPDVAERLADPLTLMMAALMAVESGIASALALNRTRLAHEVAEKIAAGRMRESVTDHQELFLHMAAFSTLSGGLQEPEALEVLEEESGQTHLGPVSDPKAFLTRIQGWLPGEKTKTWIGVIEPDIVGESFVLGRLQDAEAAVLRAAARRSEPTIHALVRIAQDFSFSEAEEYKEPLLWLARLIEIGEADRNFGLLMDLSDALPQSSVALRITGLKISTAICDRLQSLYDLLGAKAPDALLPLLALSMNNLATRQSDAGQREAALQTGADAAGQYRKLVKQNRDVFLPYLATSLNNLAAMQRDAGQREVALQTAEESLRLRRELADRNRDAFLPALAMSLNNLANRQSEAGQREAALHTAEESAEHWRELTGRNRDAFLPYLATSLNNLAVMRGDAGQREAALKTAEEAAGHYRELAGRNRDAFLPDLAMSLNNLANRQSEEGQQEAALQTAEESAGQYRELAGRNRDAFAEVLAKSCWTVGDILATLNRPAEAIKALEEAMRSALYGAQQYPAAYFRLCLAVLRRYLSICKEAQLQPDNDLLQNAVTLLSPYLKNKGE